MNGMEKDTELTGLADLKKFLAAELGDSLDADSLNRAFQPLTDGLGLESPKERRTGSPRIDSAAAPAAKRTVADLLQDGPVEKEPQTFVEPRVAASVAIAPSPERALQPPSLPMAELSIPVSEREGSQTPPELPTVGWLARVCSAIVDQVFVLTLWAVYLVLASNWISGGETGASARVIDHFRDPQMLRVALFGFAAIWLSYLVPTVAWAGRTFGMWAWGIRVNYGAEGDDLLWLRRIMRVFWSFIFYAPIASLLVLAVRMQGKNLLDILSGTYLYREA